MRAAAKTISEKMRTVPLLRALVPFVCGIVCETFVEVPLTVWIVATAACAATAILAQKHPSISTLYTALAILLFGATLARFHTPREVIPRGERVWIELRIDDNPSLSSSGRSFRTSGVALRWRREPEESAMAAGGRKEGHPAGNDWHPAGEKLIVGFDTMWRFEAGRTVVFRGYVNPIASGETDSINNNTTSYSRLMSARGYSGRTYISKYSRPEVSPGKAKSLALFARKMQAAATARLRRLLSTHNEDAIAVAAAMTTGDRTGITPELKQAYSRTGASHLLAVSGLHVGMVFLIINVLLYLLPLARHGHIAKNILAVVAIWLYASLTGLSPSATRAAFMFTGAQAALASSRSRSAVNIMCGTALVMLAVRPGLLFDISFQLSFIAVAAILAWFGPLYRLVES
ncbi:MAG: ComEC/Rec2 family competence protein, partial [Alistipes sp.]|nr:ComEC/Rec2 family competence protein [Alistipes sp.]